MNEEDIRSKIVSPYLKKIGFNESDLDYEFSFKIRLGRGVHIVGGETKAGGRADILCKKFGKNLFVIEVKTDGKKIDDNDIDQGISYARLLDQIAPLTIITNGNDWKIFETISKEEITEIENLNNSPFFKDGCTISQEVELRLKYLALKHFISLNPKNLESFCKSQVEDRMGTIKGSISNEMVKYDNKLFFNRKQLEIEFEHFIKSDNSIFGIVGDSGVGKTNVMCSISLEQLNENFVFFYNAALIKSPLKSISEDLNNSFSSRNEKDEVLKKLDEIGRYINKHVLIFIDAIDENIYGNITQELSDLALWCKNFERIKIILSCKTNMWDSIIKFNGKQTHLYTELQKQHEPIIELNNCPGYLLNKFNEEEINVILPLYQKKFNFYGEISKNVIEDLKNGFLLKIFSIVYRDKKVPENLNDKFLINEYLNICIKESGVSDIILAKRNLAAIGEILLNGKYSRFDHFEDEGVDVYDILESPKYSYSDIREEFFNKNILVRAYNENTYKVNFYFSRVRDYIICFYSLKLDKLEDNDFYNLLPKLFDNYIGISALKFYLENPKLSHLKKIEEFKINKAKSYVKKYNDYLDNHFFNFKEKFDPRTKGEIGILMSKNLLKNNGFALFPITEKHNKSIEFDDTMNNMPFEKWEEYGISTIHSVDYEIFKSNQEEVIKSYIFSQLKVIIGNGNLPLFQSKILFKELLINILYFYQKKLNISIPSNYFFVPRFEDFYPINLSVLKEKIDYFKFYEFYKNEKYPYSELHDLVKVAIEKKENAPNYTKKGTSTPIPILSQIIEYFQSLGYEDIINHYLPIPIKSISETRDLYKSNYTRDANEILHFQYGPERSKLYIKKFFKYLEIVYKEFVDHFFPTLKQELAFYNDCPHKFYFFLKKDILVGYSYKKSKSQDTKFNFISIENSIDETLEKANLNHFSALSLHSIILNRENDLRRYKTIDSYKSPDLDSYCIIRSWIFKLLYNDLRYISLPSDTSPNP